MQSSPDLHLPGTFNARRSGTDAAGAPWLVRAAALDRIQPEGIDELRRLGVTTVVDLRDTSERPPAAPTGLNVISAPLYRLPDGAPATGDIDGIYRLLVEGRARELTAAVALVARAEGAVLVHCTLGKDRTGLVVALARLAAGDDRAAVIADYEISGSRVPAAERERVQHEVEALRLPAELAAQTVLMRLESPAWALEHALNGMDRAYGSPVAYLLAHGLAEAEVAALRSKAESRGETRPHTQPAPDDATSPRHGSTPTSAVGEPPMNAPAVTPAAIPTLTVLHLSDLHARSDGPLYGVIDAPARVRRVATVAERAQIAPEVIVVTGDLVDHADRAAYPLVADALEELSAVLGAPVLVVPGNHDAPEFEAELSVHPALHRHRLEVGPWRLLGLDTGPGDLAAAELDRLRRALSEPHRTGTILVMHHSPVASPLPSLRGIGLQHPEALGELIAGSDIRAVLCGHYHHALGAWFAGVPVWVGPALSYAQVMDAGAGQVQGQDVAGFSVVRLDAAGAAATPYPLVSGPPLFTVVAGSKTGRAAPAAAPANKSPASEDSSPATPSAETHPSPDPHPFTDHPHDPNIPITQITTQKTQKG